MKCDWTIGGLMGRFWEFGARAKGHVLPFGSMEWRFCSLCFVCVITGC